jgi:hypothetical protein
MKSLPFACNKGDKNGDTPQVEIPSIKNKSQTKTKFQSPNYKLVH